MNGSVMKYLKIYIVLVALGLGFNSSINAQYFGKNKPRYSNFDFKVLQTPNLELYYYLNDTSILYNFARQAEHWYALHQSLMKDTFSLKNPLILYNNHADFQQTGTITGSLGIGTGGVTEGLKNRVVMPLTMTNQQTNHVLGHEMVHAFQYHMIINGDSTSLQSLSNIPLWMVEGLAEYMSIGRVDPHTAMWLRDAVMHDDIPSIKDLYNMSEYFPYRYGHAFWAFVTGLKGDQIIEPLFRMTARYGLESAIDSIFGMGTKNLSAIFQESIKTHYGPLLGYMKENFKGRKIISDENAGRMNISPGMSPNGRYLVFFSEKNLFSTDLFLADARSGKIIRKISSLWRDGHLDDLNFLESAGTWSPDSKQFAFIAVEKGRNIIVIKEALTGKTTETIVIKDVPAISNPAWSPNGKAIVFSGLVNVQVDLYMYDLKSGKTTQLTNDKYSEIQPDWNLNGTKIVFSTDRLSIQEGRYHGKWTMNLAILDLSDNQIHDLRIFPGADNLNPNYDHEGNILFLSNRDGFRNIYKLDVPTSYVYQMTDMLVGISGITPYAPAISVSKRRDRIVFTHYFDKSYNIFQSTAEKMLNEIISPDSVTMDAAVLPVTGLDVDRTVQSNFEGMDDWHSTSSQEFSKSRYKPKFKLDYISGNSGVGVGTGTFGTRTGLAGGVNMIFSDILGENQIYSTIAMNGDILDVGGAVQYLNQKRKLAWGASISHIPLTTGFVEYGIDTLDLPSGSFEVLREDVNILRIFEDQLSLLTHYAFSKTLRWEANAGIHFRSFRLDQYPNYYDPYTLSYIGQGNREHIPLDMKEINVQGFLIKKGAFYSLGTALVGDNSSFGFTSPLNGYRYRIDVNKYLGTYDFLSTTGDVRVYQYLKPVSLAFRLHHYARYGRDANSFNPILVGTMGLVHGYDYNQIIQLAKLGKGRSSDDRTFDNQLITEFKRLSGSKFFVSGFEVRLPFIGPERLSVIKSGILFSDLSFFFDAGVAFDAYSHFSEGEPIDIQVKEGNIFVYETIYEKPRIALSTGVAMRINFFGALVLEPYLALPIQKDTKVLFGVNFVPGW
jgi:Tol biopolymer transport system component